MRAHEFLVEYNRQITAHNLGKRLIQQSLVDMNTQSPLSNEYREFVKTLNQLNTTAPTHELESELFSSSAAINYVNAILAELESRDPTTNKKYSQWLARVYAAGKVRLEDINRHNILGLYDLGKRKHLIAPEDADINKFNYYFEFEQLIYDKYFELLNAANLPAKNNGNAKELYRDETVRIIQPLDQESACYYGQATKWCTAATSGHNMFDSYANRGPLYILLPVTAAYPGDKYQLHFVDGQFMNEKDNRVNVYELITTRFPKLFEFFKAYLPGSDKLITFATSETIENILNQFRKILLPVLRNIIKSYISKHNIFQVEADDTYGCISHVLVDTTPSDIRNEITADCSQMAGITRIVNYLIYNSCDNSENAIIAISIDLYHYVSQHLRVYKDAETGQWIVGTI